MLRKNSLTYFPVIMTGLLFLKGCSFFESTSDNQEVRPRQSLWQYQKTLQPVNLSTELSGLTRNAVTIKGQCRFSSSLVQAYKEKQRTIMLPFLQTMRDGSLAPDFNDSKPIYEALESFWVMAPAVSSVQLYQRWVGSIEQACPDNLHRKIPQCSLKSLTSISHLWGGGDKKLYNFERLNLWLEQKPDLRLLLIPDLKLLHSKRALSLRYSPNSSPVVRQETSEKRKTMSSHLGQASLDWIQLGNNRHLSGDLVSAGQCSVIWQELDELKQQNAIHSLDYQKRVEIDKAMKAFLLNFINDAFQDVGKNLQDQ